MEKNVVTKVVLKSILNHGRDHGYHGDFKVQTDLKDGKDHEGDFNVQTEEWKRPWLLK